MTCISEADSRILENAVKEVFIASFSKHILQKNSHLDFTKESTIPSHILIEQSLKEKRKELLQRTLNYLNDGMLNKGIYNSTLPIPCFLNLGMFNQTLFSYKVFLPDLNEFVYLLSLKTESFNSFFSFPKEYEILNKNPFMFKMLLEEFSVVPPRAPLILFTNLTFHALSCLIYYPLKELVSKGKMLMDKNIFSNGYSLISVNVLEKDSSIVYKLSTCPVNAIFTTANATFLLDTIQYFSFDSF